MSYETRVFDVGDHGPCPHCGRCRDCGQSGPVIPNVGTSPWVPTYETARPIWVGPTTSPLTGDPFVVSVPLRTNPSSVSLNPCL